MAKKKTKKATASPVAPKSSVKGYNKPLLHEIATKIVVDDKEFVPQYESAISSVVTVYANLETNPAGQRRIQMPHRSTVTVDCGFSIDLPPGYKAVLKALPEFANRGLIVNEGGSVIDGESRVTVTVTNVGKEIIVLEHGKPVAQMYIEPVYRFSWDVTEVTRGPIV